MKRERVFQEVLEEAIRGMREALERETGDDGTEQWDPDAWEEEVRQFTRQLGQRLVQTWGEVKAEQAKAQSPFAAAGEDGICTDGSPCGG